MNKIEFDLDSLYESLLRNPHSIDGDFNSSLITYDSGTLSIDFDDNSRIDIDEIVSEDPENGTVNVFSKSENENYVIQFFKPATFKQLNF